MFKVACILLLMGSVALPIGCSRQPAGPKTVKVTGPMTLDGEPVVEGNVVFRRLDGDLKSFGGRIQNGKYQITVEPGKMAVEIFASREVPGKFTMENAVKEPVVEMYIPEQFNTKTKLVADITEEEDQTIPFLLTSG